MFSPAGVQNPDIKGALRARVQVLISGLPVGLRLSSFRTGHIPKVPGRSKLTKPKFLEWARSTADRYTSENDHRAGRSRDQMEGALLISINPTL